MTLSHLFLAVALAAPSPAVVPSASVEGWIVRAYPRDRGDRAEQHYVLALADLDGDGRSEALVYLLGQEFCGSGGCTLAVLARAGAGWRLVSRATVVSAPVRVLRTRHHGWLDLAVRSVGGGVRAHEAVLAFDGARYARNPSVVPARKGPAAPGTVVIRDGDPGIELRR